MNLVALPLHPVHIPGADSAGVMLHPDVLALFVGKVASHLVDVGGERRVVLRSGRMLGQLGDVTRQRLLKLGDLLVSLLCCLLGCLSL